MPRNIGLIKEELVEQVADMLKKYGFRTSYYSVDEDDCFDIVAKREDSIILVKTLINVDKYDLKQASDLKKITLTFSAIPLLVGMKTRRGELEEGLIYERYGLKVMNFQTLELALKGDAPMICVKRGGVYVKVNGKRLRRARLRMGFSLGELAKLVGVSRKAIYEYERGNMYPTIDVALKLEEVLDEEVIETLDISKLTNELKFLEEENNHEEEEVVQKAKAALKNLGLKAEAIRKAPFNLVAARISEGLRMVAEARRKIREIEYKRLSIAKEMAEVIEAKALVFVEEEERKVKDLEGVPVVTIDELKRKGLHEVLENA